MHVASAYSLLFPSRQFRTLFIRIRVQDGGPCSAIPAAVFHLTRQLRILDRVFPALPRIDERRYIIRRFIVIFISFFRPSIPLASTSQVTTRHLQYLVKQNNSRSYLLIRVGLIIIKTHPIATPFIVKDSSAALFYNWILFRVMVIFCRLRAL